MTKKTDAEDFIKGYLNITPKCETPVFSVDGGTYAEAQSVEISCATSGAKIYYTTDGLTPTESSTEYTGTPVSVSASKLLRAIAIKLEVQILMLHQRNTQFPARK